MNELLHADASPSGRMLKGFKQGSDSPGEKKKEKKKTVSV
jgi:hypothetical protein